MTLVSLFIWSIDLSSRSNKNISMHLEIQTKRNKVNRNLVCTPAHNDWFNFELFGWFGRWTLSSIYNIYLVLSTHFVCDLKRLNYWESIAWLINNRIFHVETTNIDNNNTCERFCIYFIFLLFFWIEQSLYNSRSHTDTSRTYIISHLRVNAAFTVHHRIQHSIEPVILTELSDFFDCKLNMDVFFVFGFPIVVQFSTTAKIYAINCLFLY